MEPIYIRTDKNGTKIFHDYTCPRCAGYGEADKWKYTGSICFACGGTGKRTRPLVIKEYTDEYAAKLEARRIAKQKKYEEDHAEEIAKEKAEKEAREKEWRQRELLRQYSENGCGPDGIGYVHTGNTYPIKDKLKAAGGRWIYGAWVCPVSFEGKGIRAVKIDLSKSVNEYGRIPEASDIIWEAQK